MFELQFFGLPEELHVLGIGTRPAALDVVDSEFVQAPCNAQLVQSGQLEAFTLGAVTQSGVIEKDGLGHLISVVLRGVKGAGG